MVPPNVVPCKSRTGGNADGDGGDAAATMELLRQLCSKVTEQSKEISALRDEISEQRQSAQDTGSLPSATEGRDAVTPSQTAASCATSWPGSCHTERSFGAPVVPVPTSSIGRGDGPGFASAGGGANGHVVTVSPQAAGFGSVSIVAALPVSSAAAADAPAAAQGRAGPSLGPVAFGRRGAAPCRGSSQAPRPLSGGTSAAGGSAGHSATSSHAGCSSGTRGSSCDAPAGGGVRGREGKPRGDACASTASPDAAAGSGGARAIIATGPTGPSTTAAPNGSLEMGACVPTPPMPRPLWGGAELVHRAFSPQPRLAQAGDVSHRQSPNAAATRAKSVGQLPHSVGNSVVSVAAPAVNSSLSSTALSMRNIRDGASSPAPPAPPQAAWSSAVQYGAGPLVSPPRVIHVSVGGQRSTLGSPMAGHGSPMAPPAALAPGAVFLGPAIGHRRTFPTAVRGSTSTRRSNSVRDDEGAALKRTPSRTPSVVRPVHGSSATGARTPHPPPRASSPVAPDAAMSSSSRMAPTGAEARHITASTRSGGSRAPQPRHVSKVHEVAWQQCWPTMAATATGQHVTSMAIAHPVVQHRAAMVVAPGAVAHRGAH